LDREHHRRSGRSTEIVGRSTDIAGRSITIAGRSTDTTSPRTSIAGQSFAITGRSSINVDRSDKIVGIDARGFIFAAAVADRLGSGLVLVRKKGKLPPPVVAETYQLEYGTDTLEMIKEEKNARVVLVDDVLATGGTLRAAARLCSHNKLEVKAYSLLINLTFLNQFKEEGLPLHSVLNY
jgi:adenine phosphoribosyltransferase